MGPRHGSTRWLRSEPAPGKSRRGPGPARAPAPRAPLAASAPAPSGLSRGPGGGGSRQPSPAGESAACPGCRAQTREVTGGILALSSSHGCRFCSANSDELCRHSGSGWIDSFRDFWKASCCSCSISRLACCRSASRSSAVCRLPRDTLSPRPGTPRDAPPGAPREAAPSVAGARPRDSGCRRTRERRAVRPVRLRRAAGQRRRFYRGRAAPGGL